MEALKRGRIAEVDRAKANAVVARIRELIAKVGVVKTAAITGYSEPAISNIKNGKRHKHVGAITVNSLELRQSDSLCRRCGDKAVIVAKSLLCVKCELLELAKQGVVTISSTKESSDE